MKTNDKKYKNNKKYNIIILWKMNSFPAIEIKYWKDHEEDI